MQDELSKLIGKIKSEQSKSQYDRKFINIYRKSLNRNEHPYLSTARNSRAVDTQNGLSKNPNILESVKIDTANIVQSTQGQG